ncbi:hypothetical protein CONPUDRAFT_166937 [Coniophora puteana RWD-64-598 SS2]|uniref:Uncharacterized protein n=1 Tax=Coniophora puteana (strain RWD-64-598) TaxID=741705 RepID=A0A5M3MJC0_CONPW|nr:uncharacterized protein CONPUDRAFT_166937 [Coniophora puteana RWD-64-598 SS2]EIW79146.1 hypothetical protein CONPUDRAFT_166937 [Coniophora puteana RWD-64-598 SS2]
MSSFDDDAFSSNSSRYLSAPAPKKQPSRSGLRSHQPATSSPLSHGMADSGAHSLAHELAAALMPEPSSGSKLLAEEFGIEYDEGAEGIDEQNEAAYPSSSANLANELQTQDDQYPAMDQPMSPTTAYTFSAQQASWGIPQEENQQEPDPESQVDGEEEEEEEQDTTQQSLEMLTANLHLTDKFISLLRQIDTSEDPKSGRSSQPALEARAADIVRRIDETTRDRESQLRELLDYDRELKKIEAEMGGNDVLGQLDELETERPSKALLSAAVTLTTPEGSAAPNNSSIPLKSDNDGTRTPPPSSSHQRSPSASPLSPLSPTKKTHVARSSSVSSAIVPTAPPESTLAHLTNLRGFSASLMSSLSVISEQAQVNGAATAEAGRKLRALKNKLGGWRAEWDSAEKSRDKIEQWETGQLENIGFRQDGRKICEEHLEAFKRALDDAGTRTQQIMVGS